MTGEAAECVHTLKTKTKRRGPVVCSGLSHKLFLILMILTVVCYWYITKKKNLCCELDEYIVQTLQWKNTGN